MSQSPGQDPYQYDPNAPEPQNPRGYGAAPSFDGAGSNSGVALAKPASVGLAQKLMYAGGALSLLNAVMVLFGDEGAMRQRMEATLEASGQSADSTMIDAMMTGATYGGLIFGVVFAGVWFLMAFLNGKGKAWARIVATILAAVNVASVLFGLIGPSVMPGAAAGGTLASVLSLVSGALAAGIIVLLWRKESSVFFAAPQH